jgi:signal transduction histidine kinase
MEPGGPSVGRRRNWKVWGVTLGLLGGMGDYALFRGLGIDMSVAGRDWTLALSALFAATYAGLGWTIGALAEARTRARADARTIREQLAALERSQRLALQNEKLAAIGRLAAGLAHEVRNPLGVIRASASMVQESFQPGEEAYRACQFIREEIERLNSLITALLGFARPTQPRLESVTLDAVVELALRLASEELRRRSVRVERADGEPPEVLADPDLLAQVLLNLVLNAAEALGEGGRIVLRSGGEGSRVFIEVADSGAGISVSDSERVFEPFFTTKPSGTGLGLSMAARIVQSHGGTIEVVPGRGAGLDGAGACFRIELPRSAPLVEAAP